jgi:hypothetical protein
MLGFFFDAAPHQQPVAPAILKSWSSRTTVRLCCPNQGRRISDSE